MNNFLSIIIPAYNSAKTITKCLNSIPKYKGIEIIVIDDCSTDNTKSILKNYTKHQLTILETKENSGAGFARNLGISKATGDYILFLDSDDYLKPGILNKYTSELKEKKYDLIFFALELNNGKTVDVQKQNPNACGTIKFIKRDFLGKLRFPLMRYTEDQYFHKWLMHKKPECLYTHNVLIHYDYPKETSLTGQGKKNHEKHIPDNFQYLVEATDMYKKEDLHDAELEVIPEPGQQWWISKARLDKLTWDNNYSDPFVYIIDRK